MILVIVESPSKAKSIRKYLGSGYVVKASVGHFRDLSKKEMSVDLNTFKPTYVMDPEKKRVVAELKDAASKASEIIIATDADREGEAIAWHLAQVLKIKTEDAKRVAFQEITKTAVIQGVKNPGKINMLLVAAQEGRRILDRIIGFIVSPAVMKLFNQRGLSAGRVQSIAVKMIVEREREINNFKPDPYITIEALLPPDWKAIWDWKAFVKNKDIKYFQDSALAKSVVKTSKLEVISLNPGTKKIDPFAPYITTTMQAGASAKLGFGVKRTMDAAQKLYENGHITYLRTDYPNLSDDAFKMIKSFLEDNGMGKHVASKRKHWNSKASAQEAHEAIRPTNFNNKTINTGNADQDALYEIIWKQAVASQMKPAEFNTMGVRLQSDLIIDGKKPEFTASGSFCTYPGWQLVNPTSSKDAELPDLKKGDVLSVDKCKIVNKKTSPPSRYKEVDLVKAMEKYGIGRPSSYASIIENIKKRKYVKEVKKRLCALELGMRYIDGIENEFAFMNYQYTAEVEDRLDLICSGKETYRKFIAAEFEQVKSDVENNLGYQLNVLLAKREPKKISKEHKCPHCKTGFLQKRSGTNGDFWGCSGYPKCKATAQDANGKPGPASLRVEKKGSNKKGYKKNSSQGMG